MSRMGYFLSSSFLLSELNSFKVERNYWNDEIIIRGYQLCGPQSC